MTKFAMDEHGVAKKVDKKIDLLPDIYDHIRILKCNRKPAENHSSYFPYDRFQYYLTCLNEIERLKRSEAVLRGKEVPSLDFYNDTYLKKELSNIYGHGLDENSPDYIKIFDNYKEERLEEIQEWINEENDIKQHQQAGMIISSSRGVPDLHALFTVEEIKLFESVGVGPISGHEWFILPRKELDTQDIVNLKTTKTLNLALFDPELSDYAGTRVIPPQAISREDRGISEKLALNIYEIMCRHPAGITYNEFQTEYRRKFKYKPNIEGLGYKNFVEFLTDLNHVVFTQSSGPHNNFMMYPTYLENLIATPMDTFWKIYHKLIIILQLFDGACKTEVLVQFFQDLYHIKLPLTSWGFITVDEFVVYLINNVKWRNDFYKVEKASLIEDKDDALGHYVVHMTLAREKAIQDKKNSTKYTKTVVPSPTSFRVISSSSHPLPLIPKKFAQHDDHIHFESDYVSAKMEDIYVVVYYVSPLDFEIVRKQTWGTLLCDAGRKWSDFYVKLTKTEGLLPANPKTFRRGLLLVVFDTDNGDYVRARYVKVAEKFRCHEVQLLDVGGHLPKVHQDNIYYMHKNVMKEMKAQVIRAGLWNVQSPIKSSNTEEPDWPEEVVDYGFKLMVPPKDKSPRLRVQFKSYQPNNGGKWLVEVKFGPNKKLQDVGQAIMNFSKTFEVPAQKVLKVPKTMDPLAVSSNPVTTETDILPSSSSDIDVTSGQETSSAEAAVTTTTSCLTGEGETTTANGNSKISSSTSGMEWRSQAATEIPTPQKKPSYQPRSYADTAAASAWRQPTESRNFGAESNAFPTLAESVNANKTVTKRPTGAPAQSSSFSYANIASSRNAKQ